jgi:hypothetical protein
MNWRRLILTVGTKLPIAMVGRQITLMKGDSGPPPLAAIDFTKSAAPHLRKNAPIPDAGLTPPQRSAKPYSMVLLCERTHCTQGASSTLGVGGLILPFRICPAER